MADLFILHSQLAQDWISIFRTEMSIGSRIFPASEVPLRMENPGAAQEEFRFR